MATEVLLIQLAPQLHVASAFAGHDAGTPQAVKRVGARGMLPVDDGANHFAKRGILVQGNKNSPQVVPVGTLVAGSAGRELEEGETTLGHLVQAALRQEGLSAKQRVKALQFTLVAEREAVSSVEFTHLV